MQYIKPSKHRFIEEPYARKQLVRFSRGFQGASFFRRWRSTLKLIKAPLKGIIHNKKVFILIGVFLMFVVCGVSYYYYSYHNALLSNPAYIYAKKVNTMMGNVRSYMRLPQNEKPVIATVTNTAMLPKDKFFEDALNGDKIIMYKKNKIAILYRPATGQVITVAELEFQNTTPQPQLQAVAGASTSAQASSSAPLTPIIPQGKILIQPHM